MPDRDEEWLELRPARACTVRPAGSTWRRAGRAVRRGLLPALTALVVVALVGGLAVAGHTTRRRGGGVDGPLPAVPAVWRYESYAGVQVQVPPTWGWGSSPVRVAGHLVACGPSRATVRLAADAAQGSVRTPYVGRPSTPGGPCLPWGGVTSLPSADAVWLDSPLPPGRSDAGPVPAETRAVGDQHVTVFSGDASLRQRILATARQVAVDGNGCPTAPVAAPTAQHVRAPLSLSVCVYGSAPAGPTLLYSERLPQLPAFTYARAVRRAPRPASSCGPGPGRTWVALGLTDTRPGRTRWDLVDLRCGLLSRAGDAPALASLTATVDDVWVGPGVTAYVHLGR
jgi:hypothetical protein